MLYLRLCKPKPLKTRTELYEDTCLKAGGELSTSAVFAESIDRNTILNTQLSVTGGELSSRAVLAESLHQNAIKNKNVLRNIL